VTDRAQNDKDGKRELALIIGAEKALAEARTLGEVKGIRDQGEAAIKWAKTRRDIGRGALLQAEFIVRSAERRLGEMMAAMEKQKPGQYQQRSRDVTVASSLADLGITKNQSSRWQKEAAVPEKVFRKWAEECREADEEMTQTGLIRHYTAIKRMRQAETNESLPEVVLPKGEYSVIILDPPWPMEKIERDCRPNQTKPLDYPTMTEDELAVLDLPAGDECHLFLWTTHRFLPMAFRLLPAWNFRYVCTFTWCKNGGFQPVGLPQYSSEFVLYARRGSPKFVTTQNFSTWFTGKRREHSRKPDEFYETITRVTCGRRLDMFSREMRDGWDSFGNETEKFLR